MANTSAAGAFYQYQEQSSIRRAANDSGFLWNLVQIEYGKNATQRAAKEARAVRDNNVKRAHAELRTAISDVDSNGITNVFAQTSAKQLTEKDLDSLNTTDNERQYVMVPAGKKDTVTVDVVMDYEWTNSPKTAREDTPSIFLKEMQTTIGGDLQKLLYNASGVISTVEQKASQVTNAIAGDKTAKGFIDTLNSGVGTFQEKISNSAGEMFPNATKTIEDMKAKAKEYMKTLGYNRFLNNKALHAFNSLYYCTDTGWNYKLPYFSNITMSTPANQFNEGKQSALGLISDVASDINKTIGSWAGIADQFMSNAMRNTEQPKNYNYSNIGDSFDITFPLFNTESRLHAANNYRLVQLLKYQSRPYRVSVNTLIPPYLYEVRIPGVRYIPYAFIRNCNVEFQGTRRELAVTVLVDNKPTPTVCIIPEAYKITLSIQSLTNELQNFMVESMTNIQKFPY